MSSLGALGRMLAVDARYGVREVAGRFAAALLLLVFLVGMFKFLTLQKDGSFRDVSFTDCFAGLFGGMSEFDPKHDSNFNLPASWLCVCLMGAFIVLSYPAQNLESVGIKQCIAAQGRWCWWASKCIWTVACTFVYWMLAIAVALMASGIGDLSDGLTLSKETVDVLGFFAAADCGAYEGVSGALLFVAGIPIVLSALYLVQLAVSVNTNPLIAFAVTTALLFYAAYYLTPLSLGNYLMLARSDLVVHNGVNAGIGIVAAVVVGALAVVVGGRVFARHDLLGKEQYGK